MGDELDGLGTGPLSDRKPNGAPICASPFPPPETGARDQSFRLIVRPDLWGGEARLRFSNALGTRPVTFDGVHVGWQLTAAALVPGSNQPVSFGGKRAATVAPGMSVRSDPVTLTFVQDPAAAELLGRKLADSFHVVRESGPMTWHAKALTTSCITAPGAPAKGEVRTRRRSRSHRVLVLSQRSRHDGARRPCGRRIRRPDHRRHGLDDERQRPLAGCTRPPTTRSLWQQIAVVNAGIGDNQLVGLAEYSSQKLFPG
jgi:hypothetical protein